MDHSKFLKNGEKIIKIFIEIIFGGKINPLLPLLKKILLALSFIAIILAPLLPREFKEFGEIGMSLLIIILAIRPLSQIFPDFGILRKITTLRREMGILCACLIFGHTLGYYFQTSKNIFNLAQDPHFWTLDNFSMW